MWKAIAITSLFILTKATELDKPVDLSYGYDETAKRCPGGQNFEYLKKHSKEDENGVWYAFNTFAVSEHCGTHIDAPYHFNKDQITLEKIPIEKLVVKGVYIDASKDTNDNYNYTLPISKLTEWETLNGAMPSNSVVLVNFGWGKYYADKDKFIGANGQSKYPGLSAEAANWIVNSKKVVGVGVDSLSTDAGHEKQYKVHQILSDNGIYGIENINFAHPLPPSFDLIVAPIKLVGGTGGPVRLIALPSKK